MESWKNAHSHKNSEKKKGGMEASYTFTSSSTTKLLLHKTVNGSINNKCLINAIELDQRNEASHNGTKYTT